jgi:predicted aspartyl protease
MGRVTVDMEIANHRDELFAEAGALAPEQVRRTRLKGVVDSGASYLVLPEAVVKQLGLPAAGVSTVRYADQRSATRAVVEEVRVELLGRHGIFRAIVEPDRTTALIGAIVMEDLDLLVDCGLQVLVPRDPTRIIAEIE